jgi:uncharacterized membrane protein YesL
MIQVVFDFLYFLAGIFLHMSLLHLFSFYETQHHPIIARARNPYLASKVWGILQLFFGTIILAFCRFQFGLNLPTLFLFLGFSFWAAFLGIVSGARYNKNENKGNS